MIPEKAKIDRSSAQALVFFDLETTDTDPAVAEIVEIAAFRPDGTGFQRYVTTVGPVPEKTYEITHIDPATYEAQKVPLIEALTAFLVFVGDAPLAGHNIDQFDLPLLKRVLQERALPFPPGAGEDAVDTLVWAQVLYPTRPRDPGRGELRNYKLGSLYEFLLGKPLENAHRADADCAANAEVCAAMLDVPVPLALARFWSHLRLPFARFYMTSGAYRLMEEVPVLLNVPARIDRLNEPGSAFPEVDTVFPRWVEEAVRVGPVDPDDTGALLKAVREGDTTLPGARYVLERHPEAQRDAEAVLRLAGSFRVKFDDGQLRAPQAEMAREVARVLTVGGVSVIQAPTGTGKTKGYLYPAHHHTAVSGARVIVATHTKVLQGQVMDELREVARHHATRAVSAKSARSFICLDALAEVHEAFAPEPATLQERAAQAVLAGFTAGGGYDLEELPDHWSAHNDAFRELALAVETHADRCHAKCRYFSSCAYQQFRRERAEAAFLVTNQAWLLATMACDDEADDTEARPHLIIDEAHNLEDVATEAFSETYTSERARSHLQRLYDAQRRKGALQVKHVPSAWSAQARTVRETLVPRALKALEAYDARVGMFVKQFARGGDANFGFELLLDPRRRATPAWEVLRRDEDVLIASLRDLQGTLRELMGDEQVRRRVKPTAEYLRDMVDFLYRRRDATQQEVIHTIHWQAKRGWTSVSRIVDLSGPLQRVWERAASVTLTSATLAPDGNFDYLLRALGLSPDTATLSLPEGLPYEQAVVLLPGHLPAARAANADRFQGALHADLAALLPAAGRSLTLFTSKARMESAGQALKPLAPLVPQRRAERDEIARSMQEAGDRHAFGTRAFMEGVNFPDLKLVSLERIPFPIPDALTQARQQLTVERKLDPWYDFYLPRALLTFTQAFGRLIRDDRRASGRGVFVLWDKRVLSATYREVVYRALPASVLHAGQLRRPATRMAFYDEVAGALGTPRAALPGEEWVDDRTRKLQAIQQDYRAGTLSRPDALQAVLALYWPGRTLKPQQQAAIDETLEDRDVLVLLPTGFGKSLAFQVPALLQGGVTLVISPLIALMDDQVADLREVGVPAAALNAMKSGTEQRGVLDEIARGELHLLYVSPERIRRSDTFKNHLRALAHTGLIRRVVFDEAHCLSEWGHDFRPDYREVIGTLRNLGLRVPVSAFTATAAPDVRQEITDSLDLKVRVPVTASSDRPNIAYHAEKISAKDPVDTAVEKLRRITQVLSWLRDAHPEGAAIVYVATRAAASRLAAALHALGFRAGAYHAGLSGALRSEVQEQFKTRRLDVMVATNAFGMGVDQENVRVVIHFHPPRSLPAYLQEAGRAGRDGAAAWAVMLHDRRDWELHGFLARLGVPSVEHAKALVKLLSERGTLTVYPEDLLPLVNAQLPAGADPFELEHLNPLLAAFDEARVLELDYRPGRVRLLSLWTTVQFGDRIGVLNAERLHRLEFTPGPRPRELDLSRLTREEADDLNCALYRLSCDAPHEVLYTPSIPVMELTPLRARLTDFHVVREELVQRKSRDLVGMREYADERGCRRRRLLRAFAEQPDPNVPHTSDACCDLCGQRRAPWNATPGATDEQLRAAYRVDDTVLKYLMDDADGFHSRYPDRPYPAKGGGRLSMILRGEVEGWVNNSEKRTLSPHERRSQYFGRLEFVPDREVRRALTQLSDDGLLEQGDYHGRPTYRISPAGRATLETRRRTVFTDPGQA